MGFLADRTVGHRAGLEALGDLRPRLHFLDRNRRGERLELEEAPQAAEVLGLVVEQRRVFVVQLLVAVARRFLQLGDADRVEEVILAVASPLVIPANVEIEVARDPDGRIGAAVAHPDFLGQRVKVRPLHAGRRGGEVLVDDLAVQADGFEYLPAAVAVQRRDAHLGHDLQQALVERLDVVLDRGLHVGDGGNLLVDPQLLDRLEGDVRVDGARAVAEQEGHVVHFPRLAAFHDDPATGPLAFPYEMVMNSGRREQRRNRRHFRGLRTVGQDQQRAAILDGL